ncbi:MAG: 50S ribosomal protein L1 [Thaumarchaeota archaeon]|nr:50S ribosomal protein L1 [Nitrososphaerota archaeon]
MVSVQEMEKVVAKAREGAEKRSFSQSFELLIGLKDIDLKKKDISINEVVFLPHPLSEKSSVCVFASGDLALRASKAGADRIVAPDELSRITGDKKTARKLARQYSFFLADTTLMPVIGRALGQSLGPRGKMPAPVPPNAPIDALLNRYRTAVRVRSRGQMGVTCKVGDEAMKDSDVAENANAIIGYVEKKLPSGMRNVRRVGFKMTMAHPVSMKVVED